MKMQEEETGKWGRPGSRACCRRGDAAAGASRGLVFETVGYGSRQGVNGGLDWDTGIRAVML